jgi:hypothetical protein
MGATSVDVSSAAPELKPDSYWSKMALHNVPQRYLLMAAFSSYMILALAWLQGTPTWLAFGLALIPWCVIVFVEIEWSYQHFGWFALFFTMAFVQLIHYSEHLIEVIQVHIFHTPTPDALAIFSKLNIEGVHFAGDTFLSLGTLALVTKFPRNKWLWVAIPPQILHQAAHTFLIFEHTFYNVPAGETGLLASPGGAIGGGTGLNRPDLHFIYNTLFTIPFVLALIWQLKNTYDEYLAQAFPDLPKSELIAVSKKLETFQYRQAETVLAPGDDIERLYIVTEGVAGVYDHDEDGKIVEISELHPGQYFGEVGLLVPGAPHRKTIRAKSDLTVLAMDQATFEHIMTVSQVTHDEMEALARARMGAAEAAPAGAEVSPA